MNPQFEQKTFENHIHIWYKIYIYIYTHACLNQDKITTIIFWIRGPLFTTRPGCRYSQTTVSRRRPDLFAALGQEVDDTMLMAINISDRSRDSLWWLTFNGNRCCIGKPIRNSIGKYGGLPGIFWKNPATTYIINPTVSGGSVRQTSRPSGSFTRSRWWFGHVFFFYMPFGKRLYRYGKSQFLIGKTTINGNFQ